jgi:hypothetical protein
MRVELWQDKQFIQAVPVEAGSITWTADRWPAAEMSLTISEHVEIDPLPRFWPFGALLRVMAGPGDQALECLGWMAPIEITREYPADIYRIRAQDAASLVSLGDVPKPLKLGGKTGAQALSSLLNQPLGSMYAGCVSVRTGTGTGSKLSDDQVIDGSISAAISRIARETGITLLTGPAGLAQEIVIEPHDWTMSTPVWDLDYRHHVTSVQREYGRTPNVIIEQRTLSAGKTTWHRHDVASGRNRASLIGDWRETVRTQSITDQGSRLRYLAAEARMITITMLPDYALQIRDQIDIVPLDDAPQRCVITSVTHELDGRDSTLRVTPMLDDWSIDYAP